MSDQKTLYINNKEIEIGDERNLLELIRQKANIDIPTFCYHSDLSVYGACRMCVVDIEGQGVQTSCSTEPQDGMQVKTHTKEIREIRQMALELILANHDKSCPTCEKSEDCKLRQLSAQLGLEESRFPDELNDDELDMSSESLVRDPNKCVLCGDCVRYCSEIQGVGAIDFAYRGDNAKVIPAFGHDLGDVECVNCGQCAAVCPTGAIHPKHETQDVWEIVDDDDQFVVTQIAPAVRVAIGEMFGQEPGEISTGKLVSALKMIGFDQVYDTSFAADLTVVEEANEFLERKEAGEDLPLFTSCCPSWVKYAEQFHPEILDNLSSCKSPQQMFGSLSKKVLAQKLDTTPENIKVVSIMPCTAKKFEAKRDEFQDANGIKEVDHVLTTQEIGKMFKEIGLKFENLAPESFDLPFGFATGGGVIFGNTGGVSEAVLRYATKKTTDQELQNIEVEEVRGEEGLREAEIELADENLKLAVVHGLKNAGKVAERVKNGETNYDLVEVMACPGGCVAGAGQPINFQNGKVKKRKEGLYKVDKTKGMQNSYDNPFIEKSYDEIGDIGGEIAHEMLHTKYQDRKRIVDNGFNIFGNEEAPIEMKVCVGTSCYVQGSQKILHDVINYLDRYDLKDRIDIEATFCMEKCGDSPNIVLDGTVISEADSDKVLKTLKDRID